MRVEEFTKDDIGVCVNYIVDEYSKYSDNIRGLANRMEYAIEDKQGWKVVDTTGTILGFAIVEDFGKDLLITSLVVHPEHRVGKTTWLLFREILKEAKDRKLLYIPIHKDMWASKLCVDGRVDKIRAQEWVDKLENRWG